MLLELFFALSQAKPGISALAPPQNKRLATKRHKTPRFGGFDAPFPRSGGAPPERKCHLGFGLNKRDRATVCIMPTGIAHSTALALGRRRVAPRCHVPLGRRGHHAPRSHRPPDAGWFFGNNFRSALFTCKKRRVCHQTNNTKPPPAGFGGAVRRSRAITKKHAFLCVFLRAAKNTKITPFSLISKVFGHV